ncbi:F-box domain-containing protein [Plasmodiophora brassicae]
MWRACRWCTARIDPGAPPSVTLCRACLRRSVRVNCSFCSAEYRGAASELPNPVCRQCYTLSRAGPPHPCQFCGLNAAFGTAASCVRCQEFEKALGPPSICQSCGMRAAFPRTKQQLERTANMLFCFLCTREYKRRKHDDAVKRRRATRPPSASSSGCIADDDGDAFLAVRSLDALPYHVLQCGFGFLDLGDVVLTLPLVCRAFRNAIMESRFLRTAGFHVLTLPPAVQDRRFRSILGIMDATHVHSLTITNCACLVLDFLHLFPSLKRLDCSGCSFDEATFEGVSFPALEYLAAANTQRGQRRPIPRQLPACPSIRALDVENCYYSCSGSGTVLRRMTEPGCALKILDVSRNRISAGDVNVLDANALQYLDVSRCDFTAPDLPLYIVSRFRKLRYLNLRSARSAPIGPGVVRRVLSTCRLLEVLDISASLVDASAFTETHQFLTALYMHNCRNVTKRPLLSDAVSKFPALTALDVSGCTDLDDRSVCSLGTIANCKIARLNLGSLVKISVKSVESLSESLTSLREIRIGGAWYVQSSDRIDARARLLNPSVRLVRHDPETDEEREKMLTQFGA